MIRKTVLFIVAALMLSLGSACRIPQAQAQMAASNVTGDWAVQMTGDRFVQGRIHLSQVGNTVIGSAVAPSNPSSGILQMSGTFAGNTLSGTWRSPKGETGWLTFVFTRERNAFSGDWGYGGRKPNGHIVARKIVATSF